MIEKLRFVFIFFLFFVDSGNKNIDLNTTTPACGADKEKVLRCYQENPREILKCSSLVEEFNSCVDQRRFGLISAKC